jgi:hypothetical protein
MPRVLFQKGQSGNPKGRPKGMRTKAMQLTNQERLQLIVEHGDVTPLKFLMSVMVDEKEYKDVRVDAAKAAAPYFHRKMPIAIEGGDGPPVKTSSSMVIRKLDALTADERKAALALFEKLGVIPIAEGY